MQFKYFAGLNRLNTKLHSVHKTLNAETLYWVLTKCLTKY